MVEGTGGNLGNEIVDKKGKLSVSSIDFVGLGFAVKKEDRGLPAGGTEARADSRRQLRSLQAKSFFKNGVTVNVTVSVPLAIFEEVPYAINPKNEIDGSHFAAIGSFQMPSDARSEEHSITLVGFLEFPRDLGHHTWLHCIIES
ncbi:unnamed protein product [Prunus armeniaca]|uniref:Uncharacterized protein n=1 Tax=Prunus armeniaca TaxID=36596 RepID=A0A6J5WI76_PRUAR|nr:unnamed protein product [Prunus armeniaca]CAB4299054.1 unnamed protein product [Prunus armeniaca]